ncbi:MAG: hypothetical protein ABIW84_01570 [Ilumatobacteraceae bacterium]
MNPTPDPNLTHGNAVANADGGKYITITTLVSLKGRVFKPNEQYCYKDIITLLVGCGCGGQPKKQVNHYRVVLDNVVYDIPTTFAVETQTPITCIDQDFRRRIQFLGNRTIDGQWIDDYNPYRYNPDPQKIAAAANDIEM